MLINSTDLFRYILYLVVFYILIRFLDRLFSTYKSRADRKFKELLKKFIKKKKINPRKKDLFKMIIKASHITLKARGRNGHFQRQKIRKYLLEKYKVVKNYKIR